jgi:hypothetical protein
MAVRIERHNPGEHSGNSAVLGSCSNLLLCQRRLQQVASVQVARRWHLFPAWIEPESEEVHPHPTGIGDAQACLLVCSDP